MATRLTDTYLKGFIGEHEYDGVAAEVKAAHKALHDGTGLGNDFIGWLNLPTDYDKEERTPTCSLLSASAVPISARAPR